MSRPLHFSLHLTCVRRSRGMSILEVMIAGTISVWVMAILLAFTRFQTMTFQNGMTDTSSASNATRALSRMGPYIRQARRVETAYSTSSMLALRMPAYDGSGTLITPVTDGQLVAFYLSDSTGSIRSSGDWLWMSVDGVPDAGWSQQGTKARCALSSGGLTFSYTPTGDPEVVTVSVAAANSYGTDTATTSVTEEFILRNHGM